MMRFLRRREPLDLTFARREAVLVPQTATHWAVHADVCLTATCSGAYPVAISDAHLDWEVRPASKGVQIASVRWDRAVIDGRFRYPIEPLAFEAGPAARVLTLTFDAGLIRIPAGPAPAESFLVVRLMLAGSDRPLRRDLWRVGLQSWEQATAAVAWLPAAG